jgi:hypothetical protein
MAGRRDDEGHLRLAVLIDADNAQAAVIEPLLAEVARFGDAIVRRIYGDFTSSASASWKKVLQRHSIKPVQQFAYSTGKNATDSALIIDAMDLLYTGDFDGFCLVTSDSDFTGLATRLREAGLAVFGFGERKTPEAFRSACHRFVFVEVLREESAAAAPADRGHSEGSQPDQAAPAKTVGVTAGRSPAKVPKKFMMTALEHSVDDAGWAELGTFGRYLMKLQPDFDSRLYGYRKLSDLVRDRSDLFVLEERGTEGSGQKTIYVRAWSRG